MSGLLFGFLVFLHESITSGKGTKEEGTVTDQIRTIERRWEVKCPGRIKNPEIKYPNAVIKETYVHLQVPKKNIIPFSNSYIASFEFS